MLLCIDIGNTDIKGALFDGARIVRRFRHPTADVKTFASISDADFNELFTPLKERGAVILFDEGMQDLDEMILSQEKTEITCQMCGRRYQVTVEELQELRDALHRNAMH